MTFGYISDYVFCIACILRLGKENFFLISKVEI